MKTTYGITHHDINMMLIEYENHTSHHNGMTSEDMKIN